MMRGHDSRSSAMTPFPPLDTRCLDDAATPWIPLLDDRPGIDVKYFRIDPIRGEVLASLRMQPGMNLPAHHHTGTVIVYTLEGRWKYKEHDWTAGPGSVVFETAATRHTPQTLPDSGVVHTFNVVQGELLFLDADNRLLASENWRTAAHRYRRHCKRHGLVPLDLSGFECFAGFPQTPSIA
jgi:2,4'-dihydroxyacetophenone dioxygenase